MERDTVIYAVCDPTTGEIRYVGKTVQTLEARKSGHRRCKENNHRANWFRKMYTTYAEPQYHILESVPCTEDWVEAEVFWIAYFRGLGARLLNSTVGGEGAPGAVWSGESKEKQRQKAVRYIDIHRENIKKAQASNVGRKQSPEWIANRNIHGAVLKAIESNRGRKQSPEWIVNNTRAKTGLKRGPEAVCNLSTGAKHKTKLSEPQLISILEMHFIFNYPVGFLCKEFGVNNAVVQRLVDNRSYLWFTHELRCPGTRLLYSPTQQFKMYAKARTNHSEETIEKIAASNRGRIVSAETRYKNSLAHKGKVPYNKGKKMSGCSRLRALGPEQVKEIRNLRDSVGILLKDLTALYSVSLNTIHRVVHHKHPYGERTDHEEIQSLPESQH